MIGLARAYRFHGLATYVGHVGTLSTGGLSVKVSIQHFNRREEINVRRLPALRRGGPIWAIMAVISRCCGFAGTLIASFNMAPLGASLAIHQSDVTHDTLQLTLPAGDLGDRARYT
jgi:hypothetical protein